MQSEQIIQKIKAHIGQCEIIVNGSDCNFSVEVTSPNFQGKNTLMRHRMVNAAVADDIQSGALHALSIKTYTPEEK